MTGPVTFSDRMRALFGGVTAGAGAFFHRLAVHPAAVFIARADLQIGGLLLIVSLPLDALDGAIARAMGRKDRRGAVLDSTLDRYADAFIFGGLAYYFASMGQLDNLLLTLAALAGTFVVSYVRARAGEADLSVKIGLFSRLERVLVLLAMLLVPALLVLGLWVLALGTNFTGLQRLWYVYQRLDREV